MCIKHKKKILTDKQYNEFIKESLQSFDITFCSNQNEEKIVKSFFGFLVEQFAITFCHVIYISNSETDFKRLLDN